MRDINSMKVLIMSAFARRLGGADVYTEELAAGLAERGHSVAVVCQGASDQVRQSCPTFVVDLPDYNNWRLLWRIAPWLRRRYWSKHIRKLALPRPDVVICSKSMCTLALARRFPQVPHVYLPHSRIEPLEVASSLPRHASWVQRRVAWWISVECERWSLLHCATTVRFTHGNVDDLRRFYRLPVSIRFDVIPPGASSVHATEHCPSEGPLRLLSIGRLVGTKNLGFLLHCLGQAKGLAWELDVVGDGPEQRSLQQLATDLDLNRQVRFHGHQDDVHRFYKDADLHVFPSRLESFGLVIVEAMSHGIPTLAIRSNGDHYRNANHEIISHRYDGLLAEDEADFRALLDRCIERRLNLTELGARARQSFLARYQWSAVLDRWETLLHELIGTEAALSHRRTKQTTDHALSVH